MISSEFYLVHLAVLTWKKNRDNRLVSFKHSQMGSGVGVHIRQLLSIYIKGQCNIVVSPVNQWWQYHSLTPSHSYNVVMANTVESRHNAVQ